MNVREQLGILRSRIMYYAKPRNRQRLMRFYAPFVPAGSLCFDIGAHLGNRSDAWLRLGAKVVAIEPQPACIRFLKKHFLKNHLKNLRMHSNFQLATSDDLSMYST